MAKIFHELTLQHVMLPIKGVWSGFEHTYSTDVTFVECIEILLQDSRRVSLLNAHLEVGPWEKLDAEGCQPPCARGDLSGALSVKLGCPEPTYAWLLRFDE